MIKKFIMVCMVLGLSTSAHTMQHKENLISDTIKKMAVSLYITTLVTDIALFVSKPFQSLIFGSKPLSGIIKLPIRSWTSNKIESLAIQGGYSFWHTLLGPVFSNHNTLFIDPAAHSTLNKDAICALKRNLSNIKYNRDSNILLASFLIPLGIYGILKCSDYLLSKISFQENTVLNAVQKRIHYVSHDFTALSLITLLTLYGFIKGQDYYLSKLPV